jgi:hypothetical protein
MENTIYSAILIVIGLIGVFRGYKVFKIYLALSAFILGFFFGFRILAGQDVAWQIGGSVIIGLLLGVISFTIYKVGMFIIFAALSAELVRWGIVYFGWNLGVYQDWTVLILSILFGATMLVLGIEKFIVILATAIGGAAYVVLGFVAIRSNSFPVNNYNVFMDLTKLLAAEQMFLIGYAALVFFGILFQLKTAK